MNLDEFVLSGGVRLQICDLKTIRSRSVSGVVAVGSALFIMEGGCAASSNRGEISLTAGGTYSNNTHWAGAAETTFSDKGPTSDRRDFKLISAVEGSERYLGFRMKKIAYFELDFFYSTLKSKSPRIKSRSHIERRMTRLLRLLGSALKIPLFVQSAAELLTSKTRVPL